MRFLVAFHAILVIAFKNGDINPFGIQLHPAGEEFPGPLDGLLLKIVTEGPVAQHLEHGVVVGVMSHLLQVVVLAGNPQALLGVSDPCLESGFRFPRKMSLNWFMPALVNMRVGSFFSTMGAEGRIWCSFSLKKSKNARPDLL